MHELVHLFLSDYPRVLAEVQEAIAKRDPEAVARAAHALKGALSNFGTSKAAEAARHLEEFAWAGSLEGALDLYARLEESLHEFAASLRDCAMNETYVRPNARPLAARGRSATEVKS